MSESIAITVVGSGYVGLVAAACFAEIGHRVLCVDNDEDKVNKLNQGIVPIHEDFLPELLGRHRASGQVQFTTDLSLRSFSLPSGRRKARPATQICPT
jgi:UDPglucose 6-dehydrogenase